MRRWGKVLCVSLAMLHAAKGVYTDIISTGFMLKLEDFQLTDFSNPFLSKVCTHLWLVAWLLLSMR